MISKSELRKKIIKDRKQLDLEKLSNKICQNIKATTIYKNAKNIFAYYPMEYEIDIKELFEDKSKNWYLPKTSGSGMNFYPFHIGDNLIKSDFGVLEPASKIEKTKIIPDLIIVPALCIDKNNYRLGYGKGFYDRFLNSLKYKNITTLTPMYSKYILNCSFNEIHDKNIDIIITENSNKS